MSRIITGAQGQQGAPLTSAAVAAASLFLNAIKRKNKVAFEKFFIGQFPFPARRGQRFNRIDASSLKRRSDCTDGDIGVMVE